MVFRRLGRELGFGGKREEQEAQQPKQEAGTGGGSTEGTAPPSESTAPAGEPAVMNEERPVESQEPQAEPEPHPSATESAPEALPDAQETYTVQAGDSLSAIAQRVYGDAGQYMRIFEANRDKLDNPDLIQPGQELVIPR